MCHRGRRGRYGRALRPRTLLRRQSGRAFRTRWHRTRSARIGHSQTHSSVRSGESSSPSLAPRAALAVARLDRCDNSGVVSTARLLSLSRETENRDREAQPAGPRRAGRPSRWSHPGASGGVSCASSPTCAPRRSGRMSDRVTHARLQQQVDDECSQAVQAANPSHSGLKSHYHASCNTALIHTLPVTEILTAKS